MALQLQNTLTGERERFEPIEPDRVGLYYCGLTVSDFAHLGHARSWVHVDVLRRWLEHNGYALTHIENFTDVNEKIVARVGEREGWVDEMAVAEYFIEQTLADMRSLRLRRAHAYPRVSEHIDEIVAMIDRLVDRGHAYEADGSVYFDVRSFDRYGVLSNQSLDELQASEDEHPEKRHPADFALWKAGGVTPADLEEHRQDGSVSLDEACEGALTWSSPWGAGRPGWHIECSAMSTTHLGDSFDIHLAGRDIVFPHNENEIAQSEAATGQQYAGYWVHTELLEIDEEKMSSSLGNIFAVRDAVDSFGTDVIRTFLLSTSHANRQAFTEAAIDEARTRWRRLRRVYDHACDVLDSARASVKAEDDALQSAVAGSRTEATTALDDDLDTRGALTALSGLEGAVNDHLEAGSAPYDFRGLLMAVDVFETIGGTVLGLDFDRRRTPRSFDRLMDELLAYREHLREREEYDLADRLRRQLAAAGIVIEDAEEGPRYRVIDPSSDG